MHFPSLTRKQYKNIVGKQHWHCDSY
jgi:hypothetical protein